MLLQTSKTKNPLNRIRYLTFLCKFLIFFLRLFKCAADALNNHKNIAVHGVTFSTVRLIATSPNNIASARNRFTKTV